MSNEIASQCPNCPSTKGTILAHYKREGFNTGMLIHCMGCESNWIFDMRKEAD